MSFILQFFCFQLQQLWPPYGTVSGHRHAVQRDEVTGLIGFEVSHSRSNACHWLMWLQAVMLLWPGSNAWTWPTLSWDTVYVFICAWKELWEVKGSCRTFMWPKRGILLLRRFQYSAFDSIWPPALVNTPQPGNVLLYPYAYHPPIASVNVYVLDHLLTLSIYARQSPCETKPALDVIGWPAGWPIVNYFQNVAQRTQCDEQPRP